ncbi:hypothetical protein B9479_007613 [Cryptococcus floricola]|uniref:Uncharacterized protein n=1 Tax=Cryptococcus floricola TaxID=2591691 RepID=A0A5D3AJQ7_9TREE|nr:hypothetical protein B9479_007613 [Cryptococcus floricola]
MNDDQPLSIDFSQYTHKTTHLLAIISTHSQCQRDLFPSPSRPTPPTPFHVLRRKVWMLLFRKDRGMMERAEGEGLVEWVEGDGNEGAGKWAVGDGWDEGVHNPIGDWVEELMETFRHELYGKPGMFDRSWTSWEDVADEDEEDRLRELCPHYFQLRALMDAAGLLPKLIKKPKPAPLVIIISSDESDGSEDGAAPPSWRVRRKRRSQTSDTAASSASAFTSSPFSLSDSDSEDDPIPLSPSEYVVPRRRTPPLPYRPRPPKRLSPRPLPPRPVRNLPSSSSASETDTEPLDISGHLEKRARRPDTPPLEHLPGIYSYHNELDRARVMGLFDFAPPAQGDGVGVEVEVIPESMELDSEGEPEWGGDAVVKVVLRETDGRPWPSDIVADVHLPAPERRRKRKRARPGEDTGRGESERRVKRKMRIPNLQIAKDDLNRKAQKRMGVVLAGVDIL